MTIIVVVSSLCLIAEKRAPTEPVRLATADSVTAGSATAGQPLPPPPPPARVTPRTCDPHRHT